MTASNTTARAFDVEFARAQFPSLACEPGASWVHFDNAGGTYPCGPVVERLARFYRENKVQPYGPAAPAAAAGEQMDAGRATIAELLGVARETLTLGPSTTQNLNTLAHACDGWIGAGDAIVVTEQDHEANIGCWERLARRSGAELRFWPANAASGELDLAEFDKLLDGHVRLVAMTHSSNIIGTVNPIAEVAARVHAAGARLVVDGVSFAPHQWPDVTAAGADAYCFSAYKTYATQLGVMYVAPDWLEQLAPQCHFFNAAKPWMRLDAAGPDHAQIAALAGLGDYFAALHAHHFGPSSLGLSGKARAVSALMHAHESALCAMLLEALRELDVRIIGKDKPDMAGREANVALVSPRHTSAALLDTLAAQRLGAKHGHFYAARLIAKVGVADPADGVLRLSFAHYNTRAETERLIEALRAALRAALA